MNRKLVHKIFKRIRTLKWGIGQDMTHNCILNDLQNILTPKQNWTLFITEIYMDSSNLINCTTWYLNTDFLNKSNGFV